METWNGFRQRNFIFEGREAVVVFPDEQNRTENWLFKMEYFNAFPELEIEMVRRGWHLAFIRNKNRWCLEEDLDLKKRFADFLTREYGLSSKCVPVGMSCGGMFAVKFAAKYPDCVSALYLDAPVLNLLSCPADAGQSQSGFWEEFHEATQMTRSDLICYREHPIDKLPVLVLHGIPVVLVYGKEDVIVPYCENGEVLERYYKEHGGKLLVIGKEGCGHHPHGPKDTGPVIDFINRHAMGGTINKEGIHSTDKSYVIRQEREEDFYAVEALIKRAFWNQYVPGCNEHYLAHGLRSHPDFIKELSLVLEDKQGRILGTVMYTKSWLTDENGEVKNILTFGPLAVEPSCQRMGYGKALLERSFEIARKLGYDVIAIFGDPDNYVARGFKSCLKYNVCLEDSYPAALLVKELEEGSLDGRKWSFKESPAFDMDMEGFDEFDRTHEKMMPEYRTSQESFFIHSHSFIKR